jgi:hypothetical protein
MILAVCFRGQCARDARPRERDAAVRLCLAISRIPAPHRAVAAEANGNEGLAVAVGIAVAVTVTWTRPHDDPCPVVCPPPSAYDAHHTTPGSPRDAVIRSQKKYYYADRAALRPATRRHTRIIRLGGTEARRPAGTAKAKPLEYTRPLSEPPVRCLRRRVARGRAHACPLSSLAVAAAAVSPGVWLAGFDFDVTPCPPRNGRDRCFVVWRGQANNKLLPVLSGDCSRCVRQRGNKTTTLSCRSMRQAADPVILTKHGKRARMLLALAVWITTELVLVPARLHVLNHGLLHRTIYWLCHNHWITYSLLSSVSTAGARVCFFLLRDGTNKPDQIWQHWKGE